MSRFLNYVPVLLFAFLFNHFELFGQKLGTSISSTVLNDLIYAKIKTDVTTAGVDIFFAELQRDYVLIYKKIFPGHKDGHLKRIYSVGIKNLDISQDVFLVLERSGFFEYVEYAPILTTSITPNDLHANQWHLKKIFAEQAWDIRTGNQAIKLAIVDDAVDIDHEDLKSVIYLNTLEVPNNGIDDDANGYIDDYSGWQAVYKNGNPRPPVTNRAKFTHGTHCAGIAAAATNNNIGIASIGHNVSIVAVSCVDSTVPGRIAAGYEGIVYAVDAGVNVISLSWGGSFSNTGQQVIDYAAEKGIVVCAAAGNDNIDIPMYPAAYKGVISVAATDINDKKASFSNYGSWVDISAPGENIWSSVTGSSNKYDYLSGTSMACPLVAGLSALMLSQNKKYSPAQIEDCLKKNADNVNAQNPANINQLGAGRINAFKTLQCVNPLYADFTTDKISFCPGGILNMTNISSNAATSFKWTVPGAIPSSSILKNPQFLFPTAGFYSIKLVVSDGGWFDSMQLLNIEVSPVKANMQYAIHKTMKGESAFLGVSMTGKGPWNLKVSDGNNIINMSNIAHSPHYFEVSPGSDKKYFLVSVSDSRCAGSVSDTAYVVIDTVKISNTGSGCGNFTLFTKTMNMGSNEIPHSIYRLKNKQYVISGITTKGDIGGKDIFVTKVNNEGHVIWTKYYGTTADETGWPLGIVEDAKGDMYIYGSSLTGSPETSILIKIDSGGTILSSIKNINNVVGDHLRNGLLLSDNRVAIVGTTGITNDQAAQIFTIAVDGTMDWDRSFNSGGNTEHYLGLEEINKKLYAIGGTSTGNGGYGSMISKMDMNGKVIWQKYFDYNHWDAFFNVVATQNSSLMLGGWVSFNGSSTFGNQDLGIIHCDTNGNKIWSKIIGKAGVDEYGGITRVNDAFYIAGATTSFDNGNSKLFVIKMDINGNIKWSKIYGATGEKLVKNRYINNIIAGHDGSILVVGQKSNATEDILLLKIDECGQSNCPSQDIVFNIQNDNTSFSNSSLSNLGIMPQQNLSASVKNASKLSITYSDKCPTIPPSLPKCQLSANFNFQNICARDSLDFYDSSYDISGKLIKQYKWIFEDNSVVIGRQHVKYLFPAPGTYKTTLIAFSDTPNACSDTLAKFITIDNYLKIKIMADKISMCKGDSVHLNVRLSCGQAPVTVTWLPSIYFGNPNAFITAVSPPVSMWVKCIAKDASDLSRTDSIFININSSCCKYNAIIKSTSQNICLDDSVDLTNISQNTGANYKWYLSLNGVLYDSIGVSNLNKVKLSKPGLYNFRLKAFGACQGAESSLDVFCYPRPFMNAGRDTLLCTVGSVKLGSKSVSQRSYLWSSNFNLDDHESAQPVAQIDKTIQYVLLVKDLNSGCENRDTINIELSVNRLDIGNDTVLCDGTELTINAGNHMNAKYLWSSGSVAEELIVSRPGIYYLVMTNKCGTFVDTINIGSKACFCEFFFPNAFSPNENAINDYFPYENLEVPANFMVFNRWGEKIYDEQAATKGWDGYYKDEIAEQGVYLYIIQYINCRGRYVYMKGTFTLFR